MEKIDILLNNFLFQSITRAQLELIEPAISMKVTKKGEYLFSEGQAATAFFIIVKGSLKIFKLSAEGNEQILHIQKPGDLVAEAIIFDFETYPAYCQALENSELIRISKERFLELLSKFPEISFQIMKAYSRRLRQLVNKIEELSLYDIKARLANYLIQNSHLQNGRYVIPLNFSKKDLASLLGTIPETLSRTLNFFKIKKIIEESKNQIIITDIDRLESFKI